MIHGIVYHLQNDTWNTIVTLTCSTSRSTLITLDHFIWMFLYSGDFFQNLHAVQFCTRDCISLSPVSETIPLLSIVSLLCFVRVENIDKLLSEYINRRSCIYNLYFRSWCDIISLAVISTFTRGGFSERVRDDDTSRGFLGRAASILQVLIENACEIYFTQLYSPRISVISLNYILKQIVLKSIWQRKFLRCWRKLQIVLVASLVQRLARK